MDQHDLHPADVDLLERLGAIADIVDPVPDDVVQLGRDAFAFRNLDAGLLHHVAVDAPELSAVRAASSTSHLHFFEFGDLSIDLEVTTRGAFCKVIGVVMDPVATTPRSVTVEAKAASFTAEVDADGRFAFDQIPDGLVRLHVESTGARRLTTRWFDAG